MNKNQDKSLALTKIDPAVFAQLSAAISVILGAVHSGLTLLVSLFTQGPVVFLSLLPISLATPVLYGAATFFMTYLAVIFTNKRLKMRPLLLGFAEIGKPDTT